MVSNAAPPKHHTITLHGAHHVRSAAMVAYPCVHGFRRSLHSRSVFLPPKTKVRCIQRTCLRRMIRYDSNRQRGNYPTHEIAGSGLPSQGAQLPQPPHQGLAEPALLQVPTRAHSAARQAGTSAPDTAVVSRVQGKRLLSNLCVWIQQKAGAICFVMSGTAMLGLLTVVCGDLLIRSRAR